MKKLYPKSQIIVFLLTFISFSGYPSGLINQRDNSVADGLEFSLPTDRKELTSTTDLVPEIVVSPGFFNEDVEAGQTVTRTLNLYNQGDPDSNLEVTLKVISKGAKKSAGASVLYVSGSFSYDYYFRNSITSLPNISHYEEVNASEYTPDVEFLSAFDVVFVSSGDGFWDNVLLGNNLAEYVDMGGSVCLLPATLFGGGTLALGGNIIKPEYSPLTVAPFSYVNYTYQNFVFHPLTFHVNTLSTNIQSSSVLQGSGISLGQHSSGNHVAAYNPDKNVVAINVMIYDGFWSGDLIQMIQNVIDWFQAGWVELDSYSSTIPGGGSDEIQVTFDATNLIQGVYQSAIRLISNDTLKPVVDIPVTLNVAGKAAILISEDRVDFGNVYPAKIFTLPVSITNSGTSNLVITNIVTTSADFKTSHTELNLNPYQTRELQVSFFSVDSGIFSADLTFATNVEDAALITIPLKARIELFSVELIAGPALGGIVAGDGLYVEGETIMVVAKNNEGWMFLNWTQDGEILSEDLEFEYIVQATNVTFVANFLKVDQHNFSIQTNMPDGGTVAGAGDYYQGEWVNATAVAKFGYEFLYWTDDVGVVSSMPVYSFRMPGTEYSLTATFAVLPVFSLPFRESFDNVADGNIPLSWTRTHDHWGVSSVNNAGGDSPEMFMNWSPSVTGELKLISPVIDATDVDDNFGLYFKHMVAHYDNSFVLQIQVTTDDITWNTIWERTVSDDIMPESMNFPLNNYLADGKKFKVAFVFDGYSYDIDGWFIDDIIVDKYHKLTLDVFPADGGLVAGRGEYISGSEVNVSVTINPGYYFLNWVNEIGEVLDRDEEFSFIMPSADLELTALLGYIDYTVSTEVFPIGSGLVAGDGIYQINDQVVIAATPQGEYNFVNWSLNDMVLTSSNPYAFSMPAADLNFKANFSTLPLFSIMATAGPNGVITPAGNINYAKGDTQIYIFSAQEGYYIQDVFVDGISVGQESYFLFDDIQANHTLHVEFARYVYTIDAFSGSYGAIFPSGQISVYHGESIQFTFKPDEGYSIATLTVDGVLKENADFYIFHNVLWDRSIFVTFEPIEYSLEVAATPENGGFIFFLPQKIFYNVGDTITLNANQAPGYDFVGWIDENGAVLSDKNSFNFIMPAANMFITASFSEKLQYDLIVEVEPPGSALVTGAGTYYSGQSVPLLVNPNEGYILIKWTDSENVELSSELAFNYSMPAHNVTIKAHLKVNDVSVERLTTDGLIIFPNPAVDEFTVQAEYLIRNIQLVDLNGKIVLARSVNAHSAVVSVSELPTGIFILQVFTGSNVIIQRVQINR
jgi:hypothetical protein